MASGRFFFHFREVFEKCIDNIGKFLVHFKEVLEFSSKRGVFYTNFRSFYCSFPGVSLMMREVSHVCFGIEPRITSCIHYSGGLVCLRHSTAPHDWIKPRASI